MKHKNNRETIDGKPSKFDRPIPGHTGYAAHIIQSKYLDGSYGLRSILHDDQGRAVPGTHYREATAHDGSALERAIKGLVSRIASDVPRAKTPHKRTATTSTAPAPGKYQSAFDTVKNATDLFPTWGTATRHAAMMWAERHFLPMLIELYSDNAVVIGGPALNTWKAEQLSAISNHGRSHGNATAATTMARHFRECRDIYHQMRAVNPSLPPLAESELYAESAKIEIEQFKAILEAGRQRLYRSLEDLATTEPKFAFAATIMVCGFVRTGEAAAVLPGDVDDRGDFAVVPIIYQEKDGKRVPTLKTKNSYRLVVIPRWGVTVLRDCIAHMTDIPAAESGDALVRASELSAWILDLLVQCGVDKALIAAAERASALFPDRDTAGLISRDIAAYLLRRDGASRMQDYAGLGQEEIDQLMGHKLQKGVR